MKLDIQDIFGLGLQIFWDSAQVSAISAN